MSKGRDHPTVSDLGSRPSNAPDSGTKGWRKPRRTQADGRSCPSSARCGAPEGASRTTYPRGELPGLARQASGDRKGTYG
jgi:hypothetical protein